MYNELEVINHLLSQVGASPIAAINNDYPDVVAAQMRLHEAMVWVQKKGWWFNKLQNWPLYPDEDDYIVIPPEFTILKLLNSWPEPCKPVKESDLPDARNFVYSISRGTIEFTYPVQLDLIFFLPWHEIPGSVQDWVRVKAAKDMIMHELEDANKASYLDADLQEAQIAVMKEDLEIRQRHIADKPAFQRFRSRVRPYNLTSYINPNVPGGGR